MKKLYLLPLSGIVIFLVIQFPHVMISPGELAEGHQKQKNECLSCHQPFRGIASGKCISCHTLSDIGRDTTGKPHKAVFHQQLSGNECSSCHSEHQGQFPEHMKVGFNHTLLSASTLQRCNSCHQKPENSYHSLVGETCESCHSTDTWVPSTFDHSAYFVLDPDHNAACKTCHTNAGKSYKSFTCYGCHEHSEKNIVAEHNEEGIYNIGNCASCHKSSNKHDIKTNSKSLNEGERKKIGDYIESNGPKEED